MPSLGELCIFTFWVTFVISILAFPADVLVLDDEDMPPSFVMFVRAAIFGGVQSVIALFVHGLAGFLAVAGTWLGALLAPYVCLLIVFMVGDHIKLLLFGSSKQLPITH